MTPSPALGELVYHTAVDWEGWEIGSVACCTLCWSLDPVEHWVMEAKTSLLSPSAHRPWVSLCSVVDLLCAHRVLQSKHWWAGDVVSCESSLTAPNEKPNRFQVRNGQRMAFGIQLSLHC